MNPKVSLFASAVRPQLWPNLFKSLEGTSVDTEVVFCGHVKPEQNWDTLHLANSTNIIFRWVEAARIKPSQCYEIARRDCSGEVVVWVADDCEFPGDVIGKAYSYWKSKKDEKLILSIQTRETGYGLPQGQLFDMDNHRFFGYRRTTPLMAPLGMMSRAFLDELGGIDRRYVCGQYENDIVMRAYAAGGGVEIFGGPDCFIDIDHLGKSLQIGESKTEKDFLRRPFALGYAHDRKILEASWTDFAGRVVMTRNDQFEPYSEEGICAESQNFKGIWE